MKKPKGVFADALELLADQIVEEDRKRKATPTREEIVATLKRAAALMKGLGDDHDGQMISWLAARVGDMQKLERDRAMLREALYGLREHFLWRYMRTKKEGVDYDVPAQVRAADAALAATDDEWKQT